MKVSHGLVLGAVLLLALSSRKKASAQPGCPVTGPKTDRMTLAEVRALAASVGFPDPDVAAAIAYAESGGFPHVIGDCGSSFGLWQIHLVAHPDLGVTATDLTDPTVNARAAFSIFTARGKKFTDWSTYNDGSYKKYLPQGAV